MPLPSCRGFAEKSADNCMGVPLFIACCFSVGAFNILSLSLTFADLIPRCLGVVLFGLFSVGTQCFLDLGVCFASPVRELPAVVSPSCSVAPWPLLLWGSCNVSVGALAVVLRPPTPVHLRARSPCPVQSRDTPHSPFGRWPVLRSAQSPLDPF